MSWKDVWRPDKLHLCGEEGFCLSKLSGVRQSTAGHTETAQRHEQMCAIKDTQDWPDGKIYRLESCVQWRGWFLFIYLSLFKSIKTRFCVVSNSTGSQQWHDRAYSSLAGEAAVPLHPGPTLLLLHPHCPRLCCWWSGRSRSRPDPEVHVILQCAIVDLWLYQDHDLFDHIDQSLQYSLERLMLYRQQCFTPFLFSYCISKGINTLYIYSNHIYLLSIYVFILYLFKKKIM